MIFEKFNSSVVDDWNDYPKDDNDDFMGAFNQDDKE